MNFQDIKKIAKKLGLAVLVEEGSPGWALLPLEKYLQLIDNEGEEIKLYRRETKALLNGQDDSSAYPLSLPAEKENSGEQDLALIEKLNQDIALLKEEIKKRELEELESETGESEG